MATETQTAPAVLPLTRLPIGQHGRIKQIIGGRMMTRRLLSLGLRIGSEVSVLQHRGQGVVVASNGTRIALGGGVASQLLLELIDNTQAPLAEPAKPQAES